MDIAFLLFGIFLLGFGAVSVVSPRAILRLHQRLQDFTDDDMNRSRFATIPIYLFNTRMGGIVAIIVGAGFVAQFFLGHR